MFISLIKMLIIYIINVRNVFRQEIDFSSIYKVFIENKSLLR